MQALKLYLVFATSGPTTFTASSGPVITIPTITLEGDANGAVHTDGAVYARKFSGKYTHRIIKGGIGHNLPQEAPREFATAVLEVDSN